jgi:glycine cleavage system aminomethyltransferase T
MTEMGSVLNRTPLHHWHMARGARMVVCDGWHVPAAHTNPDAEAEITRTKVGLVDISAMPKLSLRGRNLDQSISDLLNGQLVNPHGVAMLDADGRALICRPSEDRLLLVAGALRSDVFHARLSVIREHRELVSYDVSHSFAGFALMGPQGDDSLGRLCSLDIRRSAFPAACCLETGLASVPALLVRPPDGPPEVQIYVAWDVAEFVWECLLQAGHEYGIVPIVRSPLVC